MHLCILFYETIWGIWYIELQLLYKKEFCIHAAFTFVGAINRIQSAILWQLRVCDVFFLSSFLSRRNIVYKYVFRYDVRIPKKDFFFFSTPFFSVLYFLENYGLQRYHSWFILVGFNLRFSFRKVYAVLSWQIIRKKCVTRRKQL